MRKLIAALALVPALFLGACATTTGVDPTTGQPTTTTSINIPIPSVIANNTTIQDIVTKVQAYAKQGCAFIPAVDTVEGVVAGFVGLPPGVDIAVKAADAICGAVSRLGMRRGASAAPLLTLPNGSVVAIHGTFVAGKRHGIRHKR